MAKRIYLAAMLLGAGLCAVAQQLQEGYVTWPASSKLYNYVRAWEKGKPLTATWNDNDERSEWEDENFFISRVRLKPYIRNAATQIYDIAEEKDKNLLFWVPIGDDDLDGVKVNALPNSVFDSEVFSLWPYVTHYGNWTSPYGWVPGSFADAAHRHGTAVSGVAGIPNATLSGNWLTCITEMGNMSDSEEDVARLGDFLYYHGVDGLGYNSEYKVYPNTEIQERINALHGSLMKYMTSKNRTPRFENPWYSAVTNSGFNEFWSGLNDYNYKPFGDKDNPRTVYFINYEWSSQLGDTDKTIVKVGRDPRDLYMGMDMQSGAKAGDEWLKHKTMDYSIGLWGAHDFNYLWIKRRTGATGARARQDRYQHIIEQWFTNGRCNPADRMEVFSTTSLSPDDDWFGMSAFMTARSSLGWNLSEEPFISFFNLGNGTFFNWMGIRQSDSPWYNIGIQDYVPTWRFWWATELLGKTPDKIPGDGLSASFTWDDAYFGGSCLRIGGDSEADSYLHLFKTQFAVQPGDEITVRYKLVAGRADLDLVLTDEGSESTPSSDFTLMTTSDTPDDGSWQCRSFRVGNASTLALVALRFANAEGLDLRLGEFSIRRGATPAPQAPVVTRTRLLAYNMSGVDGKIIFDMPSDKAAGEPVYNLDVNASMFRLYVQYEGGRQQFAGATTSWAGLCYAVAPDVEHPAAVRLGVSAVSADRNTESAISWGEYMPLPEYVIESGIEIDREMIKPGDPFTVRFSDLRHEPAQWTIRDSKGATVAASSAPAVSYGCTGLPEAGIYDLLVGTAVYPGFVQVSAADKGTVPEIESLTVGGRDAADAAVEFTVNEKYRLGYTGRAADGAVSQGIAIGGQWAGTPVADLGLAPGGHSFTLAAWVRFNLPEGNSALLSAENRAGSWPNSNWGFMWIDMAGKNSDVPGRVDSYVFRISGGNLTYKLANTVIPDGGWAHVALTFDWNGLDFRSQFYVNGVEQEVESVVAGLNEGQDKHAYYTAVNNYSLTDKLWLCFGGGRSEKPYFNDGVVDDVVVWDGVMTADDVRAVMSGLDAGNLSDKVIAYWDMETPAGADGAFAALGSKAGARFGNFSVGKDSGGTSTQLLNPEPVCAAGSPYIAGDAFRITTAPKWSAAKAAAITDAAGDDRSGEATVSFTRGGDYTVRLSLSNAYGFSEKEYPVFAVADDSGLDGVVVPDDAIVYVVDGMVFVDFSAAGRYTVEVHDVSGRLAGSDCRDIAAGDRMGIRLAGNGAYIISVLRDGRLMRAVKVLNR